MAKYKIIPSSRTIVQSPISIGHKAEKGVEAIEFDLTAWVETYGSGTLTVIMRRWGDTIPYPIALEIDEDNKATWTLSDIDTAKAGMAYAQLSYIVGETVVKKSDIYTFRVMDSLTGEGEPPEAYESWLEQLTHIAAEAMAEVLDIEGIVTDKTLSIDGGIADAKAAGEALAEKVDAADYNELSARVGANTIALAEKADQSNTYTKAQVDGLIEDVTVETDTTLAVSGAPADAKKVGDELSALNESLDDVKADLGDKSNLETLDKTNIVSAINSLNGIVRVIANRDTSWAGIRENVKSGYGEILYPVGTDFSVSCPSGAPYNDIVFTVVNHRIESGEPIMTLLMKRCIYGIQFDAVQAAFVASEAMAAGTYHFKLLDGYDTGYDGGKYVQFTIVNPLVAGDQIVITWAPNQSWIGKNAYVYHAFDTTPVETCVMSEGQGGTYLGVADGSSANLNHTYRLRYGSNNWKESAVREWLNSDAQAGAWQTQQTKFQRPCPYASSKAGFISYLDPSFVAVVRTGTHLNCTNQVFDLLGTKVAYSTDERFFLLSNEEIGFASESGIVCGSLFSFYDGANNDDRIKYDITNENTARVWWLRTPYPSNAIIERIVTSSGALSYGHADNGYGAAAACEI